MTLQSRLLINATACIRKSRGQTDVHQRTFLHAYKFGVITNGLGIVRDIAFYDADYIASHPEIGDRKEV